MSKIFLGGTCMNSTWRDQLIPLLHIEFFNPVVNDWKEENYKQEISERETCDFCLYVITPEMHGVYSIAEAVDDSNKRPHKTIFSFLDSQNLTFDKGQRLSLERVGKMIHSNGGIFLKSLKEIADYVNAHSERGEV